MKKSNLNLPATKEDLEKLVTRDKFDRVVKKLVTKKEFRQELKKLVTKKEFRRELKKLATKEELNQLEKILRAEIRLTAEETKEEIKEEFGKKLTKTESRILEAIDDFAKEIQTSRGERINAAHQTAEDRKRIEALEQKVFVVT